MDEKSAIDELQFIKKIIEDSKAAIIYNGKDYIVWGVLVAIGLLLDYSAYLLSIKTNFLIFWAVIIGLGWIYSFLAARKRKRESCPKTFAGRILGAVWLSIGIGMTVIGFVGLPTGAINGNFISATLSVFLGVAFLISGFIHDETWIKFLSIGWWLGAVYMFFFPGIHTVLVMALMLLCLQVAPGIFFYQKYKKEIENRS